MQFGICVVYSLVLYRHKMARDQFKFDLFRWSITGLLMILLLIINSTGNGSDLLNFIIFGIVVVVELAVWLVSRVVYREYFVFPVELDLLQNRWGVWVMIIVSIYLSLSFIL